MQPYVTNENVSHMPKATHTKPKSTPQLSKQRHYNSQIGRVCVSIVMQGNMAAVLCQVNTRREVNALQMFAEDSRGTNSMRSVINCAMVLFCVARTVDMRLNVTGGPI